MILGADDDVIGPLYVLALSSKKTISQNTISFYFQPKGQLSFVDFGAPSLSFLRDVEEL